MFVWKSWITPKGPDTKDYWIWYGLFLFGFIPLYLQRD